MKYWESYPHGLPEINCVYCTNRNTRNEVIEECARVAVTEGTLYADDPRMGHFIAAAIRALKDKP